MPYSVEHAAGENIVIARIFGEANMPDLYAFAAEIVRVAVETNCFYILTDMRASKMEISITDLYSLPGHIAELIKERGLDVFQMKRAFVAPREWEIWLFYETVAVNRGHSTKMFDDLEAAKAWLLEWAAR